MGRGVAGVLFYCAWRGLSLSTSGGVGRSYLQTSLALPSGRCGPRLQGTLMARDLARHISDIPPSAVPSGFLEEAGLHGSASDILGRHSMASLMRRYSALLRVHLTHAEAKLEKVEQATALKRKRLEVRRPVWHGLWPLMVLTPHCHPGFMCNERGCF